MNKKLSEILLQLHISEKSGRGVPRIVKEYGQEAFEFRDNAIVVTIPFNRLDLATDTSSVVPSDTPSVTPSDNNIGVPNLQKRYSVDTKNAGA